MDGYCSENSVLVILLHSLHVSTVTLRGLHGYPKLFPGCAVVIYCSRTLDLSIVSYWLSSTIDTLDYRLLLVVADP